MCKLDFINLEERLNYKFNNPDLLRQALTHSSYANEQSLDRNSSNERLEYLGDAVLELMVSKLLYNRTPTMTEGDMTRLRSQLVCEKSLCTEAHRLDIGSCLLLGRGEDNTGGRTRPSILADAFEAVTAAVFLDGGMEQAESCIGKLFMQQIGRTIDDNADYKSILQEHIQTKRRHSHSYRLVSEEGPDHEKTFTVEVIINGKVQGTGTGKSKKSAEQAAAKEALKLYE